MLLLVILLFGICQYVVGIEYVDISMQIGAPFVAYGDQVNVNVYLEYVGDYNISTYSVTFDFNSTAFTIISQDPSSATTLIPNPTKPFRYKAKLQAPDTLDFQELSVTASIEWISFDDQTYTSTSQTLHVVVVPSYAIEGIKDVLNGIETPTPNDYFPIFIQMKGSYESAYCAPEPTLLPLDVSVYYCDPDGVNCRDMYVRIHTTCPDNVWNIWSNIFQDGYLSISIGAVTSFSGVLMPYPLWNLVIHTQRITNQLFIQTSWPYEYLDYCSSFKWTSLRMNLPWIKDYVEDIVYTTDDINRKLLNLSDITSYVDPEIIFFTQLFWFSIILITLKTLELSLKILLPEMEGFTWVLLSIQRRFLLIMSSSLLLSFFISFRLLFTSFYSGIVLGSFFIGLFFVLCPIIFFIHYRLKSSSGFWENLEETIEDTQSIVVTGCDFLGFKEDRRWWFMTQFCFLLVEAFFTGIIPHGSTQLVFLIIMTIIYLCMLVYYNPYVLLSHLFLDVWIYIMSIIIYVYGFLFSIHVLNDTDVHALVYIHEITIFGWLFISLIIFLPMFYQLFLSLFSSSIRNAKYVPEMAYFIVLRQPYPDMNLRLAVPFRSDILAPLNRIVPADKIHTNTISQEQQSYVSDTYVDYFQFRNLLYVGYKVKKNAPKEDNIEPEIIIVDEQESEGIIDSVPLDEFQCSEQGEEQEEQLEINVIEPDDEEEEIITEEMRILIEKVHNTRQKLTNLCNELDIDSENKLLEDDEKNGANLEHILARLEVSCKELINACNFMRKEIKRMTLHVSTLCLGLGEDENKYKLSVDTNETSNIISLPKQLNQLRDFQAKLDELTRLKKLELSEEMEKIKEAWFEGGVIVGEVKSRARALELAHGVSKEAKDAYDKELKDAIEFKNKRINELHDKYNKIIELRTLLNADENRLLDDVYDDNEGTSYVIEERDGKYIIICQETDELLVDARPRIILLNGLKKYCDKLSLILDEEHNEIRSLWARIDPFWMALRLKSSDLTAKHTQVSKLSLKEQRVSLNELLIELTAKEQTLSAKGKEIRELVHQVMELHTALMISDVWESFLPDDFEEDGDGSEEFLNKQCHAYKKALEALNNIKKDNIEKIHKLNDEILKIYNSFDTKPIHVGIDINSMYDSSNDNTNTNTNNEHNNETKSHFIGGDNYGEIKCNDNGVYLHKNTDNKDIDLPATSFIIDAMHELKKQLIIELNKQRHELIIQYSNEIRDSWSLLGVSKQDRAKFKIEEYEPTVILTQSNVDRYKNEAIRLNQEALDRLKDIIPVNLKRLKELWKKLDMQEAEDEFLAKYPTEKELYTNDAFQELQELYSGLQSQQNIIKLIQDRKKFINKIIEFENSANDYNRLFRSSKQLMEEEQFRKTCYPSLRKKDDEVLKALRDHTQDFGVVFWYPKGIDALATIEEEIANRPLNLESSGLLGLKDAPAHSRPNSGKKIDSGMKRVGSGNSTKRNMSLFDNSNLISANRYSSLADSNMRKLTPLKKK